MRRFHLRLLLGVGLALCALLLAFAFVPAASAEGPNARALERVIAAQERHTERLLAIKGVVGTAAGADAVIVLARTSEAARRVPRELDGVPVLAKVSGEILALSATGRYDRPVPIGVSTGNAGECSAGTIACRVSDGANVYALSNNHVFALENKARKGSEILQPGLYDTNCGYDPNNVMAGRSIQEVLEQCSGGWMAIPGVVGTAVGELEGKPCIRILALRNSEELARRIPSQVAGFPVVITESGEIRALE